MKRNIMGRSRANRQRSFAWVG